ncbi:MAG: hypothetical protein JWO59_2481, partial [Chloroflexi bacterium]|nr:hypothetical protein [Chloroflexota bacterium]
VLVTHTFGGKQIAKSDPVKIIFAEAPPTPGMTWDDIRAAHKSSVRWAVAKWGLIAAATFTGFGWAAAATRAASLCWGGLAVVTTTVSTVADSRSNASDALAKDPIDPNFTKIARASIPAPLLLPPATGVDGAVIAAYDAFATNVAEVTGITDALVTSLNRAHGALQARNRDWTTRQLEVAGGFAARDAALVGAESTLLARLRHAAEAAGLRVTVSAPDAQRIEQELLAHGVPSAVNRLLQSNGIDPRALDQLIGSLASSPAPAGPFAFPDFLTDPGLLAAIDGEAAALRAFAARHSKSGSVSAVVVDMASVRVAQTRQGDAGALVAHLDAAPGGAADGVRPFAAAAPPSCGAPPPIGTPTPPAPQAGSFALTSTKLTNPNAPELRIYPTSGTATWDHPRDGGKWTVEYTFKVPRTLTPGRSFEITVGIKVDNQEPNNPNSYQISARAPDFVQALTITAPATMQASKPFTVPFSASFKATSIKDVYVVIGIVSAEVTYTYHRP